MSAPCTHNTARRIRSDCLGAVTCDERQVRGHRAANDPEHGQAGRGGDRRGAGDDADDNHAPVQAVIEPIERDTARQVNLRHHREGPSSGDVGGNDAGDKDDDELEHELPCKTRTRCAERGPDRELATPLLVVNEHERHQRATPAQEHEQRGDDDETHEGVFADDDRGQIRRAKHLSERHQRRFRDRNDAVCRRAALGRP